MLPSTANLVMVTRVGLVLGHASSLIVPYLQNTCLFCPVIMASLVFKED